MIAPLFLLLAIFSPKRLGFLRAEDLALLCLTPVLARAWWRRLRAKEGRPRSLALFDPEVLYPLFVAWAAIATILSLLDGANGRGFWAAATVTKFAEFMLIYAVIRPRPSSLSALRLSAGLAILLLTVIGAWEVGGAILFDAANYTRAFNAGWFAGESNHVAGALVLLAPLVPALSPVVLVAVACSGSRMALGALLAVMVRHHVVSGEWRRLLLLVATCALLLAAAPPHWTARYTDLLPTQSVYAGPHVDRWEAWRIAFAETPPWTGVGLGARPSAVYESNYVFLYAETGLPGLLFFIAFLVALLRMPRGRTPDAATAIESIALGLLLLSFTMNVALIARLMVPLAAILAAARARSEFDPLDEGLGNVGEEGRGAHLALPRGEVAEA